SGGRGRGPVVPGIGQNITPNAAPIAVSPLDRDSGTAPPSAPPAGGGRGGRGAADAGAVGGSRGANADTAGSAEDRPRVIVHFPENAGDMLLSGTLAG